MSRGPDAGTALNRAIERDAASAGLAIELLGSDWTRWASVTFTGARHELTLAAPASAALDDWLAALPEAELPLFGHLVADLKLVGSRVSAGRAVVVIEALTVETR